MEEILFEYISKYMDLSLQEKEAIVKLNIFKYFSKNEILLRVGDISDFGYFVIKGCIRTYYIIDGEEKTTAFYSELDTFNPICSINKKPSEYYVSCVEDCILIVANSHMETEIFEKFPRFESLCRILSEKLLAKNRTDFDEFMLSSPEDRYLNLVKNSPRLLQRVPQYQIASFLGITPQSLSRLKNRIKVKKR
jgi:CRP-like cAMP-binding protein